MTTIVKRAGRPVDYLSETDVVIGWGASSGWSSAVMTPTRGKWIDALGWTQFGIGDYPLSAPEVSWSFPTLRWSSEWPPSFGEPRILRSDDTVLFIRSDYFNVQWLQPTIGALNELFVVDAADDFHGQPDLEYVIAALRFLAGTLPSDGAAPAFSSLNDGGVVAEWHRGGLDVEVTFSSDPEEQGIYVRDKATGEEHELPLTREAFAQAVGDRLRVPN